MCVRACSCVLAWVSVCVRVCVCAYLCACVRDTSFSRRGNPFFPQNQLHSQKAIVYGEQQLDSMRRNGWLPIFDSYNKDRPGYQVRA